MGKNNLLHDVSRINSLLMNMPTEAVIAWAVNEFGDGLTFACSFSIEDMVVLEILLKIRPQASVFILDTGRLPQETYDLIEKCMKHYGRAFEFYVPDTLALEALLREAGPNSFYKSVEARKRCCHIRKVQPLVRALAGKKAWLTGLRREQSVTRADLRLAEIDDSHGGIVKLNPLAFWSETQVWEYLRSHNLPYNTLYDQGYSSIGCVPCTRAIQKGEDVRAGRWWWEQPVHKECGLHCALRKRDSLVAIAQGRQP